MPIMRISAVLWLLTIVGACASGGETGPSDAATVRLDGPRDAPPSDTQQFDAVTDTLPQDVMFPSDAPPGSNLFCMNNSECTVADECCFDFLGQSEQGICITGSTPFEPFDDTCIPD
jgi:hypothetical protein